MLTVNDLQEQTVELDGNEVDVEFDHIDKFIVNKDIGESEVIQELAFKKADAQQTGLHILSPALLTKEYELFMHKVIMDLYYEEELYTISDLKMMLATLTDQLHDGQDSYEEVDSKKEDPQVLLDSIQEFSEENNFDDLFIPVMYKACEQYELVMNKHNKNKHQESQFVDNSSGEEAEFYAMTAQWMITETDTYSEETATYIFNTKYENPQDDVKDIIGAGKSVFKEAMTEKYMNCFIDILHTVAKTQKQYTMEEVIDTLLLHFGGEDLLITELQPVLDNYPDFWIGVTQGLLYTTQVVYKNN